MIFVLLLFIFFQIFSSQASTSLVRPFNPPLQHAAFLLQSFQRQAEGPGSRSLPAHLTKALYTAGRIVTGQDGIPLDLHRRANEQEKKLYLSIAFTMGIDLAARWRFVPFHDIATYFEKSFGLKEGDLLYAQPHLLQSRVPLQHCFLMTLAALAGYQAVTTSLSHAFTLAQTHYVGLRNIITHNRAWLEPILTSIHKENGNLYLTLNKIYTHKENHCYLLKEDKEKQTLEIPAKPLHFTRSSPPTFTPWYLTPKDHLRHFINDYIPTKATIKTFAQKLRAMGFMIMSLEEAQNFFITLWLYNPSKAILEAFSQGLDQDLYEAFSQERKRYTGAYFGVTIPFHETVSPPCDEEKPLLFLQLAGGGFNLSDGS